MKNINLQNPVELEAKGELNSKHCKPVLCIETGTIYTSATDAANAMGVNPSAISLVCIGKVKTCKGNHFCYLSKITENISAIAVQLQEVESLRADANAYRQQQKENEEKLDKIHKLEAELFRREELEHRAAIEYERRHAATEETRNKLNALKGNPPTPNNANNHNEEEMWTA